MTRPIQQMSVSRHRRHLLTAVKLAVTLGIFGYLATTLNWASIGANLMRSDAAWLAMAELAFGTSLALAGLRWWLLLRVQGIFPQIRTACALTFVGQFFNLFLLGSVGGDAAKLVLIAKLAPEQKTHAAISILVDRMMGLAVLLLYLLALFPLQAGGLAGVSDATMLQRGLWASLVLMGLGLALLAFLPFQDLAERSEGVTGKLLGHRLFLLAVQGIRRHRRARRLTLGALGLSVVLWALVFSGGYCAALAIRLEVGWFEMITMLGVVTLASSLPISIGGHGVREGGFMLMFALYGVHAPPGFSGQKEAAIAFSILFFALWAFWGAVGGILFLLNRGSYPDRSAMVREMEEQDGELEI